MVLFPAADINTSWRVSRTAGRGLANLGNTCFLNSVIQCLLHNPAFSNFLATRAHSNSCRLTSPTFCMICTMDRLRLELSKDPDVRPEARAAMEPRSIVGNLSQIAPRLRPSEQADSHEFLVGALETMHQNALASVPHVEDVRVQETSVIYQIFGGYFRSQIICQSCGARSNSYDVFFDLSLNLTGNSVLEALAVRPSFTSHSCTFYAYIRDNLTADLFVHFQMFFGCAYISIFRCILLLLLTEACCIPHRCSRFSSYRSPRRSNRRTISVVFLFDYCVKPEFLQAGSTRISVSMRVVQQNRCTWA